MPSIITPLKFSGRNNFFSVDLECWEQILTFDATGDLAPACDICRDNTKLLLDLLEASNAFAVFFTTGGIARTFPELVRDIVSRGHEIGSHGYSHAQVWKRTPESFNEDLKQSLALLSDITGSAVRAYRAPAFSIREVDSWPMDILSENGILIDSSVFPFKGARYGNPDVPRGPFKIEQRGYSMIEAPPSTLEVFGKRLPVAGGGYFRFLPYAVIRAAVKHVNSEEMPFIGYCHPYEFGREDMDFSRLSAFMSPSSQWKKSVRFNLGRRSITKKIAALLKEFRFTSFEGIKII